MKFTIQGYYVIAKVEEKGKVNLYTLLDEVRFEKIVLIGNKVEGIEGLDLVEAEIDLTIKAERKKLFINNANLFLRNLSKVEA
ncbi:MULTISPECIES: hypothetical protein [Bacillus]|uniref:hypothetical protein n=1 Tax=Bacillus TaxID=1386 RepID=UPI0009AE5624|nr:MULTISPECIES: hypothetical protein [Bacillus]MCY7499156.1 hypothetical protein [Bacillus altitudinis]MCY7537176.1 hypothetical protein [Bacillus altitudinis]MCY7548648.1 hypothetical protein [Bacillus altitudinis]MCY7555588.1 hypothetical protein [Bacillus altitudinis]MCY7591696.1 hypothetical protein [Bacillus altitudinis]